MKNSLPPLSINVRSRNVEAAATNTHKVFLVSLYSFLSLDFQLVTVQMAVNVASRIGQQKVQKKDAPDREVQQKESSVNTETIRFIRRNEDHFIDLLALQKSTFTFIHIWISTRNRLFRNEWELNVLDDVSVGSRSGLMIRRTLSGWEFVWIVCQMSSRHFR